MRLYGGRVRDGAGVRSDRTLALLDQLFKVNALVGDRSVIDRYFGMATGAYLISIRDKPNEIAVPGTNVSVVSP